MARKRRKKIVSRAQARLFGAVIGGIARKAKTLTKEEARRKLRGVKIKKLPRRKGR